MSVALHVSGVTRSIQVIIAAHLMNACTVSNAIQVDGIFIIAHVTQVDNDIEVVYGVNGFARCDSLGVGNRLVATLASEASSGLCLAPVRPTTVLL